jgi:hypothetical protein
MAGKQDKSAAREAAASRRAERKAKRGQIFEAFKMQRRDDPGLLPWMIAAVVGAAGAAFVIGLFLNLQWVLLPLGVVIGLLLAVIIFGRRVQRNVFSKADGQPGAAAWALDNLRGGRWVVTQAVAGTTQLDAVHRVIGRPGIVLVAEGVPHRVKGLLAQEKKRIARVVGDTPIYDVTVGNDEGQIPLRKLQRHMAKLPKNIGNKQIDSLETRLAALSRGPAMPKGPMPQGAKMRNVQRTIRRR